MYRKFHLVRSESADREFKGKTPKTKGRRGRKKKADDANAIAPRKSKKLSDGVNYCCSICKKKWYKYKRNRLRHEKYECDRVPRYLCAVCGKRYSQNKTLVGHIDKKHANKHAHG